jgi:hypothetical protein
MPITRAKNHYHTDKYTCFAYYFHRTLKAAQPLIHTYDALNLWHKGDDHIPPSQEIVNPAAVDKTCTDIVEMLNHGLVTLPAAKQIELAAITAQSRRANVVSTPRLVEEILEAAKTVTPRKPPKRRSQNRKLENHDTIDINHDTNDSASQSAETHDQRISCGGVSLNPETHKGDEKSVGEYKRDDDPTPIPSRISTGSRSGSVAQKSDSRSRI